MSLVFNHLNDTKHGHLKIKIKKKILLDIEAVKPILEFLIDN